jgi:hypothetical protein
MHLNLWLMMVVSSLEIRTRRRRMLSSLTSENGGGVFQAGEEEGDLK